MPNARLIYLFEQYLAKTCTAVEKQELAKMILISQHDKDVQDLMLQAWDTIDINEIMAEENADEIFGSIIDAATEVGTHKMQRGAKIRQLWRRAAVVAACGVLIIGLGWHFLFNTRENSKPKEIAQLQDVKPPANNRATIKLANGQVVYLDSVNKGMLAQQGNVNLQKIGDGQIVYHGTSTSLSIVYNTLTNPKGSKVIDITLNDGSRVWLNVGSSLTYPVVFVGNERKVNITGEAYFEVAKNAGMPFRVKINESTEVEVLGTHFNVNAYADEADIKTTLLEGSVKVSIGKNSSLLKPGQQAVAVSFDRQNGNAKSISINNDIDLDQVMAWKNGLFNFNKVSLQEMMKQIAKWYDVDIEYQGEIKPKKFGGEIQRNLNLSEVLEGLKETGIHFRIEGKKLIVLP